MNRCQQTVSRLVCRRYEKLFSMPEKEVRVMSTSKVPFYGAPRPVPEGDDSSSALQRLTVAIHSATTAFSDPTRADAVAALGEVTGHVALTNMYDRMMSDPTGQRILRDRPLVNNTEISIEKLLPPAEAAATEDMSFGQAYASFMKEHGFDPDDRSQVKHISDPELAYIMLRYRQCHDYWHTLTGLPPTVLGELALKWLELLQTGLPVAALSATVGSLRLGPEERLLLTDHYFPWAVRMSKQADYLLNVYYEEEFDTNLCQLRERLRIEPAPQFR